MELKDAFGASLRHVRHQKGLTQEDFSIVSSRTNISLLERGATNPTLEKLAELCQVLDVHPVSLLSACYMRKEGETDVETFLARINRELQFIVNAPAT
ncbi:MULTISPECIES: helix-turn-helix domain-containing protein [unclassified Pseudomonas]|uniref:helix-turn-helix domain-containing protein n=1 Tax=unclassified Pseudomonas TaxID=196821 RepID=UPI0015879ABD|nr:MULTISPECIES: helix-turn-helix transcriptional regulator [unclassified Pseudomonas]QKV63936.1 helix-turn-helix transcriptional regulator [Pseudomonas sp. 43A]QMW07923.1 helix-turn-helix transcriptional regulator [Pseudomonas sp. 29A]